MTAHPRRYLDARVGDVMPMDGEREDRLWERGEPRWHCLLVPSGTEPWWRDHLGGREVSTTYPEKVVAGRKRDGTTVVKRRPDVPGYVFARFPGEVRWHVLHRAERPWRVLTSGLVPVKLKPKVIFEMQGLPEVEAEREAQRQAQQAKRARQEAEARRLAPGQRVTFDLGGANRAAEIATLTDRAGQWVAQLILDEPGPLGVMEIEAPAVALERIDIQGEGD